LGAVLFLREIRIQIAVVMVGIVLIEAGVWKITHQLLPNDRRYHALRYEIDAFIALSRDLNEAALAAKVEDTPENQRAFDEIREAMHRAVDQISDVAGRTRLSHKNFTCLRNASNLLGQSAKSSRVA
jgi:hypothetical protein